MSKESDDRKVKRIATRLKTARANALRLVELLDFTVSQIRDDIEKSMLDDAFSGLDDASRYVMRIAGSIRDIEKEEGR